MVKRIESELKGLGSTADGKGFVRGVPLKGRHLAGIEVQSESLHEDIVHLLKNPEFPMAMKGGNKN